MRRWKLLVALAGLAVLVAAGAFVSRLRPDRITQENVDRIRAGMTRAEVEAIFSGPPGDYRTVWTKTADKDFCYGDVDDMAREFGKYTEFRADGSSDRYQGDWVGNEGFVGVVFESGVVQFLYSRRTVRIEQSPIDNLLWRAKRQWRKWFPED
jgi:hypothetical protein